MVNPETYISLMSFTLTNVGKPSLFLYSFYVGKSSFCVNLTFTDLYLFFLFDFKYPTVSLKECRKKATTPLRVIALIYHFGQKTDSTYLTGSSFFPHFLLGLGLIHNSSTPPLSNASCGNQNVSRLFPLRRALLIYIF